LKLCYDVMTFFRRFFAALDGPEPASSLDLVADEMRFAIFWTAGSGRESEQHIGGKDELLAFVEAGGVRTWTHYVTRTSVVDGVEMVIGETRYDDSGDRAATFMAAAKLDEEGRMTRYMVARTPAIAFAER
jgi:hypothetical protein